MPNRILLGQVWRSLATNDDYLVTRVGKELFNNFAVMRKVSDDSGRTVRVNIQKMGGGVLLPGYVYTQEET